MELYLAIALTLFAALGIAAYSLFIRIGTAKRGGTINEALIIILLMNLLVVGPATVVFHRSTTITLIGIVMFVGAGLIATVLGRICYYKGIEFAGSSRTEPLKATQLIYATILPIIILGEVLTSHHLVGILCILVGVIVISIESQSGSSSRAEQAKTGILFGFGSGLFYGLEPTLAKIGLQEGIPILLGITIKTVTALLLFTVYLWASSSTFIVRLTSNWWFVAAGVANTIFLVAYYGALSIAPVTIVYPILQTSPLFIIALSLLLVPAHLERITWSLVVGAVIIVVGTVTVVTA